MKHNLSSVYQIRDSGSGQIRNAETNYLSLGFAKIAPWCLARRANLAAKEQGQVTGWAALLTQTTYTRWPL